MKTTAKIGESSAIMLQSGFTSKRSYQELLILPQNDKKIKKYIFGDNHVIKRIIRKYATKGGVVNSLAQIFSPESPNKP